MCVFGGPQFGSNLDPNWTQIFLKYIFDELRFGHYWIFGVYM